MLKALFNVVAKCTQLGFCNWEALLEFPICQNEVNGFFTTVLQVERIAFREIDLREIFLHKK